MKGLTIVHVERLEDAPAAVAAALEARSCPGYLDSSTIEFCGLCRCKTLHVALPSSGERACEWHPETRGEQA